MADPTPVADLPQTKKIVVLSLVGVVVVLSIVAALVPETRVYAIATVKALLDFVPMMFK